MDLEPLRALLGWCTVINAGVMVIWLAMFFLAHDFIYRMHSRWFKIPVETFDAIHYSGMALYKIAIYLLNIVPWLALHIVG